MGLEANSDQVLYLLDPTPRAPKTWLLDGLSGQLLNFFLIGKDLKSKAIGLVLDSETYLLGKSIL